MPRKTAVVAMWSIVLAVTAARAAAADVTPRRLVNARSEPQNWLMIHHDYDNSRHSSLTEINRDTVKNLELKYTFSIGGRSTGGILRGKEESTPLIDDGYMYVTDTWSRVMKFDVRSGTKAIPPWRYGPKIRVSLTTRGLAMYGQMYSFPPMEGQPQCLAHPRRQCVADRPPTVLPPTFSISAIGVASVWPV